MATESNRDVDICRLWHIWNMNGPDIKLSCEIAKLLKENKCLSELDIFLRNLPNEKAYLQDETLNRARIYAAFWKQDFEKVYKLIEENSYSNGSDLIDVWDLSHYQEEEMKRNKPLTPLAKFRIREKFIPPKSILPSRTRKKTTLPKDSKKVLESWLNKNHEYPYPSREIKQSLAEITGLSQFQVSTYFANARRKIFQKLREERPNPKQKSKRTPKHKKKSYEECKAKIKTYFEETSDESSCTSENINWYPSNQNDVFSSYTTADNDMMLLMDKVNQCMRPSRLCADGFTRSEYPVVTSNMYPVARDTATSTPSICCHDYYSNGSKEKLNQDVKNDDAAEILINLSNRLTK